MQARSGSPAGAKLRRVLEHRELARRRVDGRPGTLGEVGQAEDVVEVGVRDEDRDAACAARRELEADLRRGAARVDDDGLRRGAVGADDVAVRGERPEGQLVDDRRHVRECTAAPACRDAARRGSVAAVKSWRVNEIEAPGGRIDPAVLTTDDGARAIAIRLDAGSGAPRPPGARARVGRRRRGPRDDHER